MKTEDILESKLVEMVEFYAELENIDKQKYAHSKLYRRNIEILLNIFRKDPKFDNELWSIIWLALSKYGEILDKMNLDALAYENYQLEQQIIKERNEYELNNYEKTSIGNA